MKNLAILICFFIASYFPNAMAMDKITKKRTVKSFSVGNKKNQIALDLKDIKKILLKSGRDKAIEKLSIENKIEKKWIKILKNDDIEEFANNFMDIMEGWLFDEKQGLENKAQLCVKIASYLQQLERQFPNISFFPPMEKDAPLDSEEPTMSFKEGLERNGKMYLDEYISPKNIINFAYMFFLEKPELLLEHEFTNLDTDHALIVTFQAFIQTRLLPKFMHLTVLSQLIKFIEKTLDDYCTKNYFSIQVRNYEVAGMLQHHEVARNNHLSHLILEQKKLLEIHNIVRDRIAINTQSFAILREDNFTSCYAILSLLKSFSTFIKKHDEFKRTRAKKIEEINKIINEINMQLPPKTEINDKFKEVRLRPEWAITIDEYLYPPKAYKAPFRQSIDEYRPLQTASGSQASAHASSPPSSPKAFRTPRALRRNSSDGKRLSQIIGRSGSESSARQGTPSTSHENKENGSVTSRSDTSGKELLSPHLSVSSEIKSEGKKPSVVFNEITVEASIRSVSPSPKPKSDSKRSNRNGVSRERSKSEAHLGKGLEEKKITTPITTETNKACLPKIVKRGHLRQTSGSGEDTK